LQHALGGIKPPLRVFPQPVGAPLRTRRERAETLRKDRKSFFEAYAPKAREVLNDILEKYIDHAVA